MDNNGKTNFDKQLDAILDSCPDENSDSPEEKTELPAVVIYDKVPSCLEESDTINADKLKDYQRVRNTLHGLLDRGQVALEGAIIIARESESPRAFDVVSNLMNGLSKTSLDLLELQNKLIPKQNVKIEKQINQQNNFQQSDSNGSDNDPKDLLSELDNLEDSDE